MSFDYNATGVEVNMGNFEKKLLPKGMYHFEVIEFVSKDGKAYPLEGKSKAGDPQVSLLVQVTDSGEYEGERIFHTVTFMPKDSKGAGIAVSFLKEIGQPWEGKVAVNPSEWVGAEFMGYVVEDEYQGKKKNKITQVLAMAKASDPLPF